MQLYINGRHLELSEGFRQRVSEGLSGIVDKYFGDAVEATVTLSKEPHSFRTALSIHVGTGLQVVAQGEAADAYASYEVAAEHLAKRLRRHKRRLRDHNGRAADSEDGLSAQSYVLAVGEEDEEDPVDAAAAAADGGATAGDAPAIVAESTTDIPLLSVSEAVMRLDLGDSILVMFRNRGHGGINVVYRRTDGHIGWIDPREQAKS